MLTNTINTKHTSGPWKVLKHEASPRFPTYEVTANEGSQVCKIFTATMDLAKDAEANAKLIAAAPEMLEALQEMVSEFETLADIPSNYKELSGYDGGDNPRTLAILKAVKIIQKAIGPQAGSAM